MLGKTMPEPRAPESIPTYIRDGLDRQDPETLADVIDYCEARIDYLEAQADRDLDEDELADDGEEVVDIDQTDGGGTKVVKKVPCGKDNCSTCPHGPYEYRVHRDGDSLRWEYIGAVE
jgi:hypothetical protein